MPSATPPRYPYAITGAVMLLLAVGAVGAAYTTPFGDMRVRAQDYSSSALFEYGVLGMEITSTEDGDTTTDEVGWRDSRIDGGEPTTEFRTGYWMVPIGGLVLLAAAITLLAAPSGGILAARIGAGVGIAGAVVLAIGMIALIIGYSDTTELTWDQMEGTDFVFEGRSMRAGAIWLGAGVILGLGGSVLGFSDKRRGHLRHGASRAQTE